MYKSSIYKLIPILLFMVMLMPFTGHSQTLIHGEIRDLANNNYLSNVNIRNIYSRQGMTVQADGQFAIEVKKGELLEFTKIGYQTVRVRIHSEKEPSFYKIVMNKAPIELREVDIRGRPLDFKKDSIRYRETYDIVIRKQKKNEIDMRSMPLAMLSKKNRQEWAFQEMYNKWEQEKYIDYVFNDKLVSKITYLQGDSLKLFMDTYRPEYEFLRNSSDYEYLDYIKSCFYRFSKKQ